jgi:hypothetical protein
MARAATLRFKQSPRQCNATTGSTQHQPTDKAGTTTKRAKAGKHQQVTAYWLSPPDQPQSRTRFAHWKN